MAYSRSHRKDTHENLDLSAAADVTSRGGRRPILRATWGDDAPPSSSGAFSCNGTIPTGTPVRVRQASPPHRQACRGTAQTALLGRCFDRAASKGAGERDGVWQ